LNFKLIRQFCLIQHQLVILQL